MNEFSRRRLLLYLGLGAAGSAAAVGVGATKMGLIASGVDRSPANKKSAGFMVATSSQSLPEFQGISEWLNSSPLSIATLKGNVVLVQFWTFACINCQRTLPYIVQWHQRYQNQGLSVIGVHTPEFAYERDVNHVKQALAQHQITYPVPLDNGYATWTAYHNQYWPHLFLADRQGVVRYDHIGEGAYDTTEQTIRQLLG